MKNEKKLNFPYVSPSLVQALDELYPERTPYIHESEREIWRYVGIRDVVKLLKRVVRQQEEGHMRTQII
jgi:hypothetical protein